MLVFTLFFFMLAGRVSASFNITLGKQVLFPPDFLNISSSSIPTECVSKCTTANTNIDACNSGDATCLCQNSVVEILRECQQCMFTQIITKNEKALDPRVGSSPLMVGYAQACLDNGDIKLAPNQTALVLPDTWDGPLDIVLSTGGTVVAVGVGAMLGLAMLLMMSNLK